MPKTFEGVFYLYDYKVKLSKKDSVIKYQFHCPYNLAVDKKLIEFRGKNIKLTGTQEVEPKEKKNIVLLDDIFEVLDIKWKPYKNGAKTILELEEAYDKEKDVKAAILRGDNVKLSWEETQQELFPVATDQGGSGEEELI